MGATKDGLIGVDFQPKRFWEKVGLARICDGQSVKQLIASYNGLARFLASMGIELVNLSKTSRLEITKGEIKDFKPKPFVEDLQQMKDGFQDWIDKQ